jgi:sulfite reductase alpha subunit-like flavoprotein
MNKKYQTLQSVSFCVYGLGDRSYGHHFNLAARKLRQRLLMLNACEVINIGLGDDQDSNGAFQHYFSTFLPNLLKYLSHADVKHMTTNLFEMKATLSAWEHKIDS